MIRLDSIIAESRVEPRPYQRRIVTKAVDMYCGRYKNGTGETEPAARSILIESPTGSGKTVMGHLALRVMQSIHPDLVVGWVAMRRSLLTQAARENADKAIGVRNIHYTSMFERSPEELLAAKRAGHKLALLCDEAQHDAANSMAHLHNILEPDFILGLSATPFRADRVKLCFDKVIKDAGIHQLIQDGYLSPYDHYTIPNWNPQTVADHYCADPDRWGKSIFYFRNLELCYELQRLLQERGHVAPVANPDEVEDQVDAFRRGDIRCLINCMLLTEGFDCPDLQTAWVRDSGKSCTIQMGGRVFRIHPSLKFKQIVQSKGTHWPFIRTAMPQQQFVWENDQWLTLKVNPKINLINHNTRLAIAMTEVQLPKWMVDRKAKKRVRREQF